MITKQVFFDDNLSETENIFGKEWITEEDRSRSFLNEYNKAQFWKMLNLQSIFGKPESREDKLRILWTKIYENEQRRKHEESSQNEEFNQIIWKFVSNTD